MTLYLKAHFYSIYVYDGLHINVWSFVVILCRVMYDVNDLRILVELYLVPSYALFCLGF